MSNSSAQMRQIPLEDFFRNDEKNMFQISPDGTKVAFTAAYQNRMNIYVQQLDGNSSAELLTRETDRSIAGYAWKNDNCIIYIKDSKGNENFHLYSIDLTTKAVLELTPFENTVAYILDRLPDSETDILMTMNQRDPQFFDVYRLNVFTGNMTMIAQNPGGISSWHTDHEGKVRLATMSDGVNTTLLYRTNEQDEFHPILQTSFREALSPLFFTFDNKKIYAASNLQRDKTAIVIFDPETATETEVIYSHDEVDVDDLIFSRKRKVITAAHYTTWKDFVYFFDTQAEQTYSAAQKHLSDDMEMYFVSKNKAEDKILVRTISDRSKGTYYLYDVEKDTMTFLANVAPWLKANELAQMKPIQYTSRDGLTIHGYLTLPNGVEAKNLPVVVNPHGGPWFRDQWMFNPEVQFLANRGYAVLQINFRGSTGYGRQFWEDSFKQWGLNMQNDITDGVQWLIEQGIANPKRIAIYGASYGGYATLAGVTFTPDLYACAIDYVGVSNLFTFMNTIPPYWKPYLEMMYEMVGHPEKDAELLRATSPVFHVDKIKAPLFVVQGRHDPRVNIDESDQIVAALQARGVDVQYMVKDDEGHGFMNQENKFELYKAIEAFFATHL
ncbi:MAG: S9 family peptidase [Chitinophagales bacterium]|nr:S9 family peptidase [Chitinophagales bacterium]